MRHLGHMVTRRGLRALVGIGLMAVAGAEPVLAQRPFAVNDPFYRGETGRRAFYDGYAFTTELSYRSPVEAVQPDPLGLSLRAEYQLSPRLDVGAVLDAGAGGTGRTLALSWLMLKYYTTEENTDRALRLAVDPAVDGRLGNPQVDLAYISTTLLRPNLSSDYAFGLRRVRLGYEQLVERGPGPDAPLPYEPVTTDVIFTRALGWEMHAMSQYALLLGPARSSLFVSGLVYVGGYDMVETSLREERSVEPDGVLSDEGPAPQTGAEPRSREYRAGALWLRTGVEYNRPAFQLAPFMSVAVKQWLPSRGDRAARVSFGLRFMLR